jgi:hypothetical protein
MHRRTLRSFARRAVAVALAVGTAVAGVVATPQPAEATVLPDPDTIAADVAARIAYLSTTTPAPAIRVGGHVGGPATAVGLRAAGFDVGDAVEVADITAAAAELGVAVSEPLTAVETGRVRDAAWQKARVRLATRGIDVAGAPDAADLAAAAAQLGVDVGDTVDPQDVDPILAAAHERIAAQLRSGSFPMGDWVDESDLRAAARLYGVKVDGALDGAETRAIAEKVAARPAPDRSPRFSTIGKVDLHLPGFGPHYVGFHQASSGSALGQKQTKDVHTDVLPSRGRGTGRGTAVDVVLRPGDDVVAPVTGKVVEVVRYSLYGKYTDVRVRIVPEDDPTMLVSMLHMEGAKVKVGDRVVGGKTVIADSARTFPFSSQIDRFSGRHWGHVHVEARRR